MANEFWNFCAECGRENVTPHHDFPPLGGGACLCEDCGDEWHEQPRDLEDALGYLMNIEPL